MPKVAIVGGSREVRLLIKGLLRLHHHVVVAEGPGFEALDSLAAESEPEVVVVDLEATDPARLEAVKAARKARPNARFVVLTAGSGTAVRESARSVGANAIVHRPFAVRDLVEAVAPGSSKDSPSGRQA
jgi:CheY-like chemotaxis protein